MLSPSGAVAQQPQPCATAIENAERQYVEERFDEAIELLSDCLNRDDVVVSQHVAAYRLTALAYVRKGDLQEARLAVVQLLSIAPNYEPDPVRDVPPYVALVRLVQEQVQPEDALRIAEESDAPSHPDVEQQPRRSWFRTHMGWVIGGGSVVIAGIITAIIAGRGGGEAGPSALPPPPDLPK